MDPTEILGWAIERFSPSIALCTSFQAEGTVILDMACRIAPALRVFTLDTGRLPQETHDQIDRVRQRYGIDVEVFMPDARRVEEMVRRAGPNLFLESIDARQRCCAVRKTEPLERALSGLSAWIAGLRRDQSPARASVRALEHDPLHGGPPGIMKVNPLAAWDRERVWAYIRDNDLPYHPLYDLGYASIGCAPCTRPTRPDEGPRAGRWWWEADQRKECGLHFAPKVDVDAGGAA